VRARILTLVLVAFVLVGAGCGGDEEGEPLPAAQVQLLNGRLDESQRRLDDGSAGACRDILNDTRPEVQKIIDSLPRDVDSDVRSALEQSFKNLWDLVQQDCDDKEGKEESQQPEEQPAEPEPTPTETTPTDEEPTEKEPTETTPTETTPPSEEQLPPEGNGDNNGGVPGNGNGNGNGSGGGTVSPGGADLGGGE
jgi:hypothetical protein